MDSPYFFEATTYWSEGDERAHFEWLERIPAIREVSGVGERVFLSIDEAAVGPTELQELGAVYRRYGGNVSQLQQLQKGSR